MKINIIQGVELHVHVFPGIIVQTLVRSLYKLETKDPCETPPT